MALAAYALRVARTNVPTRTKARYKLKRRGEASCLSLSGATAGARIKRERPRTLTLVRLVAGSLLHRHVAGITTATTAIFHIMILHVFHVMVLHVLHVMIGSRVIRAHVSGATITLGCLARSILLRGHVARVAAAATTCFCTRVVLGIVLRLHLARITTATTFRCFAVLT